MVYQASPLFPAQKLAIIALNIAAMNGQACLAGGFGHGRKPILMGGLVLSIKPSAIPGLALK